MRELWICYGLNGETRAQRIGTMMTISPSKKLQLERFKEAARELGTDDDEERFNEKLGKLAKSKPQPRQEIDDE